MYVILIHLFLWGRLDSWWLYIFGHYSVSFDRIELIFGYVGSFWLGIKFFFWFSCQGVRNVLLASLEDILEDLLETGHFEVSWEAEIQHADLFWLQKLIPKIKNLNIPPRNQERHLSFLGGHEGDEPLPRQLGGWNSAYWLILTLLTEKEKIITFLKGVKKVLLASLEDMLVRGWISAYW